MTKPSAVKSQETSTPASTDCEPSNPDTPKTTRGRKTFRSITDEHVHQAMTYYLRSLKMINADEEVIHMFKTPEGFDIKLGVLNA